MWALCWLSLIEMATLAASPSLCLSSQAASDTLSLDVLLSKNLLLGRRLQPHFTHTRNPSQKHSNSCVARNVPPEKGRGKYARKAASQGVQRIMKGKEADMEGWTEVAVVTDFQEGKNKAIIYNNKGYILVRRKDDMRAIEANCTSCKFPIIEGKVTEEEDGGLGISCPLCHTKFSLDDGRIVQYCPKDGPLQWVIGNLKEKAMREAAKVVPARVSKSGRVYLRFVKVKVI